MSTIKGRYPGMMVSFFAVLISAFIASAGDVSAGDVETIKNNGVLRHLGIPYANFVRVTPRGLDGLDVELMQLFAGHLGVKYQFVRTCWSNVFADLTGKTARMKNGQMKVSANAGTKIKGDIIANGLTILPHRKKIVDFSNPTFPTGVWLAARADSPLKPITPSGNISQDIVNTKALLGGKSILTMKGTCLDPALYDLDKTGANILFFSESENLDDLAPAIILGKAEATLLDIPDAMVALQEWPGDIKIIGPVSENQLMGVAVAKNASGLLEEFNRFFDRIWKDGTYGALVEKYYPSVFLYLGDFFDTKTK